VVCPHGHRPVPPLEVMKFIVCPHVSHRWEKCRDSFGLGVGSVGGSSNTSGLGCSNIVSRI